MAIFFTLEVAHTSCVLEKGDDDVDGDDDDVTGDDDDTVGEIDADGDG